MATPIPEAESLFSVFLDNMEDACKKLLHLKIAPKVEATGVSTLGEKTLGLEEIAELVLAGSLAWAVYLPV